MIKRLPGGKEYLYKRNLLKNYLFKPGVREIYQGLHGDNKSADAVFLPAFDRIFLLLSAFYQSGLRGDILEFGVMLGYSSKLLADCLHRFDLRGSRLHLFDSFEGLPKPEGEDLNCYECQRGFWQEGILKTPPGLETLIKKALEKKLGNGRLFVVKGYFEKTLERHIEEKKITKAALVNLDCDLYSSSKYVLQTLIKYELLQEGTILICDDWMTSFGNPHLGQRKAVAEVLQENPHWEFEKYMNYGLGSHVFIAHENKKCCTP